MTTVNPHFQKTTFMVVVKVSLPFFFLSTYFLMRSLESDFMSPHTRTHIQSVVKHILCSYVLSLTLAHTHTFLPRTFGFFRSQHITVQKNINRIVNWKKKKKKKKKMYIDRIVDIIAEGIFVFWFGAQLNSTHNFTQSGWLILFNQDLLSGQQKLDKLPNTVFFGWTTPSSADASLALLQ